MQQKIGKEILVSCKDSSTVGRRYGVITHIVNALNVLELRKEILGFNASKLFVKVPTKYKKKISGLFKNYKCSSNTEVIIH